MFWSVFVSVLVLLPILVVAGGVLVYVAFPHRGQQVPGASWLGDSLHDLVDRFGAGRRTASGR